MKKYLKLQAKKSLSLFLAVLMLMSCWVWVAPEEAKKAEAAEITLKTQYKVEVHFEISNKDAAGGNLKYKTTSSNGWGTQSSEITAINSFGDKNFHKIGKHTAEFTADEFPSWIRVETTDSGTKKARTQIIHVKINGKTVYENGGGWDGGNAGELYPNNDLGTTGNWEGTYNWPKPHIAGFVDSSASADGIKPNDINLTLNKIGKGTVEGKTSFDITKYTCYDQYDVGVPSTLGKYCSTTESTYISEMPNGEDATESTDIWVKEGDNQSVVASPDLQVNNKQADGAVTYYLVRKYVCKDGFSEDGTVSKVSAKINVNYPQYTINFNAGMNAAIKKGAVTLGTNSYSVNGYHGSTIEVPDKDNTTATGNTFYGYWEKEQPTEGDAYYYNKTADFAVPVSSDDFVNVYGGTEGGTYVEKDGKKYYNAGEAYNPDWEKTIDINEEEGQEKLIENWHGWWCADDITVKFYDIDGVFLGTQTTKYGKTEAEEWYKDPKDSYKAGAFEYQTFANQWRDITGKVITEGSYEFGSDGLKELSLTPIYENKTYNGKYSINFINPNNGANNAEEYDYRHILEGAEILSFAKPSALDSDPGYTYEFAGWTSQKPTKGNYHKVAQNDTSVTVNQDWVVREDMTYYAVYRSTVKEYLIAFKYTDTTGTEKTDVQVVPYGSVIATPVDVNRTYNVGGILKTLEKWTYTGVKDGLSSDAEFSVDDTVLFLADKVYMLNKNLAGATPEDPIVFQAAYDQGKSQPFIVTFKYKDATGAEKVITTEVEKNDAIDSDTISKLNVPETYDDGEALYTFGGEWQVTAGKADKEAYTKDEFATFMPTSDITFEAAYDDGVPFYTVTYIDGDKSYSERVTEGSNLPAWTVTENGETKEYVPADREAATGTYKFAGWYDEKQADADEKVVNGNKYTKESIVNGDLTLYSQFEFEAFKYIIKFMDYTGKIQLSIAEVEAGQSFADAFYRANTAAQYRAPDETYTYEFIGWDQPYNEDNLVCEGKDVTYIAQYKPNYIYYKANWYSGIDTNGNLIGDPVATTKYTYNGKIYAPSVNLEIETGKAFDGWYYKKDGVETAYQRGMIITADMSFYAKYRDVAADTVRHTVTTVVDGITATYTVVEGNKATQIGNPADVYVSDEKHNTFDAWYTAENDKFDIANTPITEDITLYAKFNPVDHELHRELISAPTYYKVGYENVWCDCDKEETYKENVEIPMLTDTKAPTGIIYLGTQGSWSSTETDVTKTGAGDTNKYYANADTDVILTINDTGDVNDAFNPNGKGKGIRNIRAFVTPGSFDVTDLTAAQALAITIYPVVENAIPGEVYNDTSEVQNNVANYVFNVGELQAGTYNEANGSVDYADLVDGNEYIIFYYAVDKAGKELNRNVRTAKFIYDTTKPEIILAGESNAAMTIFCDEVTIKEIEAGATVEVNGEAVEYTGSTYTIDEAGNYLVTVTDKAGNKTTKKFAVNEGHKEVTTERAVDCYADGYKKVACALCNKVISETTTPSTGHSFGEKKTVAADCFNGGYDVEICTVCGFERITNETSKLDHVYGDYVVVKEATCSTDGKKYKNCTLCGKGTVTEVIPADGTTHVYGAVKVLKPTCKDKGEEYQTCKYCFVKKVNKTLDEVDHAKADRYDVVTKEATCCEKGVLTTYCKTCDEVVSTADIAMIPHTLKLVTYDKETDKSEEFPNGYTQYECQAMCQENGNKQCTYTEGKEAIVPEAEKEKFTVTFIGAGAEGADLVITVTEGESIAADAVADQTKAEDNEYKYTFAGWKGTDGKVVNLPFKVTKNEKYTAEFKSTVKIYTHKFLVVDDAVASASAEDVTYKEFATIIGTYNSENKKPVAEPKKAETAAATYEFVGWKLKDTDDEDIITDFTMKSNEEFVAVFKKIDKECKVNFFNGVDKVELSKTIKVGATIARPDIIPVKDSDDTYHYAFKDWYVSSEAAKKAGEEGKFDFSKSIGEDTRIYAGFTATEHSFDTTVQKDKDGNDVTWAATCTKKGQTTTKCDCGEEKVTVVPMIEHNYVLQENGDKVCSVCGDTIKADAKKVTITFNEKVGDDTAELAQVEVEEGKDTTFTAPEKAATEQHEYKFVNWTDAEGNVVSDEAELKLTAVVTDATYTANYTVTVRVYNVTYVDADNKVIGTPTKVVYGGKVPAAPAAPSKKSTEYDHFTFVKWSVAEGTTVYGDILIRPEFKQEAHDYDEIDSNTPPTCTTPGGTKKLVCVCGKVLASGTPVPATGHNYIVIDRKEATYDEAGYIKYECQNENCPEKYKEEIVEKLTYKKLTVKVVKDNNPVYQASVQLRYKNTADNLYATETNNKGEAVFELENGEYTVIVNGKESKNIDLKADLTLEFDLSEKASDDGSESAPCSCSCHRNGFQGILFRFFHKFISWFTGRIGCCNNPDPRY